ncbi:MAG: ATP-dependent helicase HrpB [Gemmatimonadales bacterium]
MLPVDAVLPELLSALADRGIAVLEAPPGAGKTTRVPPALLQAEWRGDGRILLLEPRRLAARAAARRIAAELGESLGHTVGFRVRGESVSSRDTRLEVVTEGVLTRMLQDDPSLPGVAAVVFDEFHERSLPGDVGLALVLGATRVLRDDLRVVVMSATLDGGRVAALLGDAPRITSAGKLFPVETRFDPAPDPRRLEGHIAAVVRELLATETGSVLVFLAGAGEIRRIEGMLDGTLPPDVDLRPLHGGMDARAQDAAIAPSSPGRRKVVLATNVAETSLTIDGVRVVVDSGFERVSRFSPRTGMTRLETTRITRASADQRRGRAGRLGPGIAVRCWSAGEDAGLVPHARAAILEADLTGLALDLAAAGFPDPSELPWLDPPPAAAYAVARALLHDLGALDARHHLTPHGRDLLDLGVHPRLAHMLIRAAARGRPALDLATTIAALAEERDILRGEGRAPPTDLQLRIDAVTRDLDGALLGGATVDRGAVQRVREAARLLRQRVGRVAVEDGDLPGAGGLASLAWPDRVARRRDAPGRFLLRSGRGVQLFADDPLAHADWIVALEVDDAGREGRVLRALELAADDAAALVAEGATIEERIAWDAATASVLAVRRLTLGAIVVREDALGSPDPARVAAALAAGIRASGIAALPWTPSARRLRERLAFLHHHDPTWPDVSDAALTDALEGWLLPHAIGVRRLADLGRLDLADAIRSLLPWARRARLDALAPERLTVPSGSTVAIDYADPEAPVLAVRLQEVFGLQETPRLLEGRVPVVMHLLSPARRPVQVTRDLASFWREGYFDVRKDLRGRYPKHRWPDDPLTAPPSASVRRRDR